MFALRSSHRVHAKLERNLLHLHLVGECHLRRSKAPKCAVGRSVCRDGLCIDPDVIAAVRAKRVNSAARQDNRSQGDIGSAIESDFDLTRDEAAIRA